MHGGFTFLKLLHDLDEIVFAVEYLEDHIGIIGIISGALNLA